MNRARGTAGWLIGCLWLAGCPQNEMTADGGSADQPAPTAPFRSVLYPENWTPGFSVGDQQFLHDFSYAGYKNGERPLPTTPPGMTVTVAADKTGATDATAAIQSAIDLLGTQGGVVLIPEGTYRVDGLLTIAQSKIVLRGAGPQKTKLLFTKATGMSDVSNVTFVGKVSQAAERLLVQDGKNQSNEVFVADVTGLKVGDDVSIGWIITPAFVQEHNMTDTWKAFNGQWKPFFRRRVMAIETTGTPRVRLDVPLRYPAKLRDKASLKVESGYLEGCGAEDFSVATAVKWAEAWGAVRAHAIAFVGVKDGWMQRIESVVSPRSEPAGYHLQNGGLLVKDSKRVTLRDLKMAKAQNRGPDGCGYLFEVSTSSEVLIKDAVGSEGRHNFIQNWDFGTTGLVFLRTSSSGSRALFADWDPIGAPAASEYHHSLTMACLVDQSVVTDAWQAQNRGSYSSGAGITATQNVFWNLRGGGRVASYQAGIGYVIGTQDITVETDVAASAGAGTGTEPADYTEGIGRGDGLQPPSLYEDQLIRRIQRSERLW